MEDSECWSTLEIAPTDDLAQIRRAYARKLKTIDTEVEPMRFVALREAYNAARAGLQETTVAKSFEEACDPDRLGSDARAQRAGRREDAERLGREVVQLLVGTARAAEIEEALADLTLRLLDAVEHETVDRHFEAEQWIASVIADHIPRSDAMIRPAVAYFRWLTPRPDQVRVDRTSIAIDRLRELHFTEFLVLREGGRHHLAYLTLQHPPQRGLQAPRDYPGMAALERFFRETGNEPKVVGLSFDAEIVAQWHKHIRRHDLGIQGWKRQRKRSTSGQIARNAIVLLTMALPVIALILFAVSWFRRH